MYEVILKIHDKKCPSLDGIDGPIVEKINRILPAFWVTLTNKSLRLGSFLKRGNPPEL